jgi:hypothetical protein
MKMGNVVSGTISEVKFNKDDLEIFIVLDVHGERKTVVITREQLIKFDTDRTTSQSIMLKYYEAWVQRKGKGLPVTLEINAEEK